MKYYIKVENGVKIFVEDINSKGKKTILFIHGWPLNHNAYEYQINQLSKSGYRCIAIDLRGFGKSDRPSNGYSYDRFADDIRVIIDSLKLNDILLVGHSMGGAISIRYMDRHNGHGVSKLALFGAAAPSWVKTDNWPYGYTKDQVNQFIKETYSDRPKLIRDVGDLFFFQYLTRPFKEWFGQICLEASGWATAECLVSLRDERLFWSLNKIKVPTLILHGVHDKICPFEFGEYMNNEIENSKLVPFEYSGHGAFYEEKDKANNELIKFIEG